MGEKMNRNIKAVIFDMDGVLIDSEIVYLEQMYAQMAARYPWIKVEDLYPVVGLDDRATREMYCRLARKSPNDPEFMLELKTMEQNCRIYFPDVLKPGVREILAYLRQKGYRTAIASSSKRADIETMLEQCQLKEQFEFVVSGEEFARSKPNPEIYLHTARKLNLRPEECFVVEDSEAGIAAGGAAGMYVAAVRELRFGQNQQAAQMMIGELTELKAVL